MAESAFQLVPFDPPAAAAQIRGQVAVHDQETGEMLGAQAEVMLCQLPGISNSRSIPC